MPDPASASPVRAGARPWADLRLRVLSALVLLPVALGALWLGGVAWSALVTLAALGMVVEWLGMCRVPARSGAAVVLGVAVLAPCVLAALAQVPAGLAWVALWVPWLWWRLGRRAAPALGMAYVALPAVSLIWLRAAPGGLGDVLFVLLVVWATDIFAYAVGRALGGARLAPAISPGKTWSGAVGGLAGALLVGCVADPGFAAVPAAALLGVVAQAGDLLESALKRRFGVKDSGRLIPGHGGLLDRLDGVMAAAPVAALLALGSGRGLGFVQ